MAVPEAAVDKDDGAIFGEDDVWGAGQGADVVAVAETGSEQSLTHFLLGLGITRADAGHIVVALERCEAVGHSCCRREGKGKMKMSVAGVRGFIFRFSYFVV